MHNVVMLNRYHRLHIDVMHACNTLCVKECIFGAYLWYCILLYLAHVFEKHFVLFGCLQGALQDSHHRVV